jgi:HlyD family secretion protein
MIRKYVLPLLALAGFIAAFFAAQQASKPVHSQPSLVQPADNPYRFAVSGSGIIEATSENIAVSPAIGGIVEEVLVKWGEQVKEGQALYRIDPRPIQAQIAVQRGDITSKEAALTRAKADLERLNASPREEDKPIYLARLNAAKAQQSDVVDQFERAKGLRAGKSVSEDEYSRRYWATMLAKTQVEQAQADYDKLMAGSWKQDIAVQNAVVAAAEADLASAKARLAPLEVDEARLTVKAPMDGAVLRVNARKGEYLSAAGVGSASDGAVVIGDTEHLNVRVDIDESDVARFVNGSPATGFVRGATRRPMALKFIRVEPFVIPKKNLTGGNTERVDTRVLQVIYTIEKRDLPLYVGQQVDVYIETKESMRAAGVPGSTQE